MSCKRGFRVFSLTAGKSLRNWMELLLVISFLNGILCATPIADATNWRPHAGKQPASYVILSERGKATLKLIQGTSARHSGIPGSQSPPSSGCIFAGNCANPVRIPESGALAVLGTGLLSIAGLLRRRLTR